MKTALRASITLSSLRPASPPQCGAGNHRARWQLVGRGHAQMSPSRGGPRARAPRTGFSAKLRQVSMRDHLPHVRPLLHRRYHLPASPESAQRASPVSAAVSRRRAGTAISRVTPVAAPARRQKTARHSCRGASSHEAPVDRSFQAPQIVARGGQPALSASLLCAPSDTSFEE